MNNFNIIIRFLFYLLLLYLFLLLIFVYSAPSVEAEPSKNAYKNFILAFELYASRRAPKASKWLEPQSPFAPFLKRPFSQGLTSEQKKTSLMLEKQGRCDEVLTLVHRGFVSLYPDIDLIFTKVDILNVFEQEIVPLLSNSYRRCLAWRKLHYVFEREKRRSRKRELGPLNDLPYAVFKNKPRSEIYHSDAELAAQYEALNTLVRLGLCRRDKPALRDLNETANLLNGRLFSEAEALYMDALAKTTGIETSHYARVKKKINYPAVKGPVSEEPQLLFSMKVRLEANDLSGAAALVPSLMKVCEWEVRLH